MTEGQVVPIVIVGIPTYKRAEGLARLLGTIEKLEESGVDIRVIVADNEGESGVGVGVVRGIIEKGYKYPIRSVGVVERGVAAVRNALLHEAFEVDGADYLAMVDDDEWVEPQWLSALLAMQKKINADAVGGKVSPDYNINPPVWVNTLKIYYCETGKDGPVDMIWGGGNCLLSKTVYQKNKELVRFHAAFSSLGGEDDEYFYRLRRNGYKMAYSAQAVTHEIFSDDRLTVKWALRRSFKIGYSHIQILSHNHDLGLGRWSKEFAVALIGLAKGGHRKPHATQAWN